MWGRCLERLICTILKERTGWKERQRTEKGEEGKEERKKGVGGMCRILSLFLKPSFWEMLHRWRLTFRKNAANITTNPQFTESWVNLHDPEGTTSSSHSILSSYLLWPLIMAVYVHHCMMNHLNGRSSVLVWYLCSRRNETPTQANCLSKRGGLTHVTGVCGLSVARDASTDTNKQITSPTPTCTGKASASCLLINCLVLNDSLVRNASGLCFVLFFLWQKLFKKMHFPSSLHKYINNITGIYVTADNVA